MVVRGKSNGQEGCSIYLSRIAKHERNGERGMHGKTETRPKIRRKLSYFKIRYVQEISY